MSETNADSGSGPSLVPTATAVTVSLDTPESLEQIIEDPDKAEDAGEGLSEEEQNQALSALDSDEDDDGVLEIFSEDCTQCSALVVHMKGKEEIKPRKRACHYTKGNEHCPGSSAKIVLWIDVSKAVRAFTRAHANQDSATLAKLYAKLATRSEYEQAKINAQLASILKNQ